MNSNSNIKFHTFWKSQKTCVNFFQSSVHLQRCIHSSFCIVNITDWSAEQSHNCISNEFVYCSSMTANNVYHSCKISVQKRHNIFRLIYFTDCCKTSNITNHNCNASFFVVWIFTWRVIIVQ